MSHGHERFGENNIMGDGRPDLYASLGASASPWSKIIAERVKTKESLKPQADHHNRFGKNLIVPGSHQEAPPPTSPGASNVIKAAAPAGGFKQTRMGESHIGSFAEWGTLSAPMPKPGNTPLNRGAAAAEGSGRLAEVRSHAAHSSALQVACDRPSSSGSQRAPPRCITCCECARAVFFKKAAGCCSR